MSSHLLNRTRPRVQLLQIMLDEIELFKTEECNGLCSYIRELRFAELISKKERKILEDYLDANSPTEKWSSMYYWEPRQLEPRVQWLGNHIKLHLEN